MPSVNKTTNLGLNQWASNEYPKRLDFVEDNAAIDSAVGKLANLVTTDKSNLVAAVNEVKEQNNDLDAQIGTIEAQIIPETYKVINNIPKTAKRGKLNAKLKGITGINLVANGDFDDATGWSGTVSIASGTATLTANGTIQNARYTFSKAFKIGDKVAVMFDVLQNTLVGDNIKINGVSGSNFSGTQSIADTTIGIKCIVIDVTIAGTFLDIWLSAFATSGVLKFDNVKCINLTALGMAALTASDLVARFSQYFDGLQGATGIKAVSCGKNLFDKNKASYGYYVPCSNGILAANVDYYSSSFIQIKPNTVYKISGNTMGYVGASVGMACYDSAFNFIAGSNTVNITTPINAMYIRVSASKSDLDTFQIEEGTVATSYEPYKGTEVEYKTLDNNAITLNRLPNGVYDEITEDGKYIKRNAEYKLQASDITNLYTTNVNNDYIYTANIFSDRVNAGVADTVGLSLMTSIGTRPRNNLASDDANNTLTHSFNATNALIIFFPKGTYANLAAAQAALVGTKLIYQLESPQILDTNATPLIAEPGGQLSVVPTSSPLQSVEFTYPTNVGAAIDELIECIKEHNNNIKNTYSLTDGDGFGKFSGRTAMLDANLIIESGIYNIASTTLNSPFAYGVLQVFRRNTTQVVQVAMSANSREIKVRQTTNATVSSPPTWSDWANILTDIQPSWITATLSSGWTGTLQYRKNQLGQLEIKTNTHITPGTLTAGTILATLPTGYRPAIDTPIVVLNYATNRAIAYLSIATDGNIKVSSADTGIVAGNNLRFSAIMPM